MRRTDEAKSHVVNFRLPPSLASQLGSAEVSAGEDAREIVTAALRNRAWKEQIDGLKKSKGAVLKGDAAKILPELPTGMFRAC